MSGFLYYLPGLRSDQAIARGRLATNLVPVSILTALQDCDRVPDLTIAIDLDHGPDGGPGLLLIPKPVDDDLPPRLGYFPELQTWSRLGLRPDQVGSESQPTWLGYTTADPPTPSDLERREQIPGYLVTDAAELSWSIPIARACDNPRGNLPYAVRWTPERRPYCGVSQRYAQFWADAQRLWDLVDQHGTPDSNGLLWLTSGLTEEEDAFCVDMDTRALAINYRVGPDELATLDTIRPGWLSLGTASLFANAIVDYHARRRWEQAQKKTDSPPMPAGASSSPGDVAVTPPFVPAEASLPSAP